MAIILRSSTLADVDAMFRVWHDAVRATHHFLTEEDIAFYATIVREQYLPAAAFTVAVDDADGGEQIVGFLGVTGPKLDSLFIDPAVHGRRIGRRLVEFARAGHDFMDVDVNEANQAAHAFYEHMGFVRIGRTPIDEQGRPLPLLHLRWTRGENG
ncbi:acetyltransferase [Hyalangium rubrum]|uniref:Acetyltransferase n=1 Tax=Hyalangium rubrum TaxID=3103134 RepID=A0ABU5HGX3_9BACT|nr:acetyltransferase [Hyalangium sp. s54d21]MDY7232124.1 acetyltransferase [Hyalangium sp. s54d21]